MNAVLEDIAPLHRDPLAGALTLPLALIRPNPWNRKHNPKLLADLADSIKKHGVMQPIVVRTAPDATPGQPLYEIVAGERRWRGSQMANLASVPCLLREMSDLEVIELMLIENLQREGLHELDEAEGYDRLLRKPDGLHGFATVEELCARIGKSRSYVFQRMKLLHLCDSGKQAFRDGLLEFSHALAIARIPGAAEQAKATKEVLAGWGGDRMSARDALAHVQRSYMLDLGKAVFKIADASLVPQAGSCTPCQKRTGSNPDLFDDIKKGDTCTDPACFEGKVKAHQAQVRAQAESSGKTIISGADAKKAKPHEHGELKGYLTVNDVHYQLGDKPLRKMLGKDLPEVLLLEDPHGKGLIEVVREEDAMRALKAAGKLKSTRMPTTSAGDREREAKAKAETAWRMAVAIDCVTAAAGEAGARVGYRQALLIELAFVMWRRLDHDTTKRVRKLLAWADDAAEPKIGLLTDGDLCRFFTACVLAGDVHVNMFSTTSKPARLLGIAAQLDVDAAAIKESLRELKRVTPANKAAAKARAKAAEVTPETALAGALKAAEAKAMGSAPAPSERFKPRVAVKYRCPTTGDSWTGRGLKPRWMVAALAAGKSLADFQVAAPGAAS